MNYQYFPEIMREIVEAANTKLGEDTSYTGGQLVYEFGTLIELSKVIQMKNAVNVDKYPLVWLVWERPENMRRYIGDYANKSYMVDPLVFIATYTDQNYTSVERYTNVFKPILIPIYEAVIQAIKRHRNVNTIHALPHNAYEHFFWGMNAKGECVLSDYLDAIELKIKDLKIIKIC